MDKKLINIFCDVLKNNIIESDINSDHHLWDSLAHLNIILSIEEEFNIDIPPGDFSKLHSDYKTVLNYIENRLKK